PLPFQIRPDANGARALEHMLGARRLSRSSEPMSDDDGGWRWAAVPACDVEISAKLRADGLRFRRRPELVASKPIDFRTHHRSVDQVKAQDGEALIVAGRLE